MLFLLLFLISDINASLCGRVYAVGVALLAVTALRIEICIPGLYAMKAGLISLG
jgi:hypothetical protein